jgi:hypothetical protein
VPGRSTPGTARHIYLSYGRCLLPYVSYSHIPANEVPDEATLRHHHVSRLQGDGEIRAYRNREIDVNHADLTQVPRPVERSASPFSVNPQERRTVPKMDADGRSPKNRQAPPISCAQRGGPPGKGCVRRLGEEQQPLYVHEGDRADPDLCPDLCPDHEPASGADRSRRKRSHSTDSGVSSRRCSDVSNGYEIADLLLSGRGVPHRHEETRYRGSDRHIPSGQHTEHMEVACQVPGPSRVHSSILWV